VTEVEPTATAPTEPPSVGERIAEVVDWIVLGASRSMGDGGNRVALADTVINLVNGARKIPAERVAAVVIGAAVSGVATGALAALGKVFREIKKGCESDEPNE